MKRFDAVLNQHVQKDAFQKQPILKQLAERNAENAVLQKIWVAIAPENLARYSHASSIKNQKFIIFADSNTVAAKIKLFIPSLLIQLEKQECEVTSIQVKVQVKSTPQTHPKAIKKLSTNAARNLNELAEKISGTALGDALSRLAKKVN